MQRAMHCRWIVWIMAAAALTGCQSAVSDQALVPELAAGTPDAKLDYWHALDAMKVTGNDTAFHGLLLFFDGSDGAADYAARVALLKGRGWLPPTFDEPAQQGVKRGTLSVAICKALQLRGGITMSLLGPEPRYATRELQHVGIYPPSSPWQTFSGPQFMAIIGRVEDYQRRKGIAGPAEGG